MNVSIHLFIHMTTILLFCLLCYILLYCYSQYILSQKLNTPHSWIAWVPILQIFNQALMSKKWFWWVVWWFWPGMVTIIITPFILLYLTTVSENQVYNIIQNTIPFALFIGLVIACMGYMKICHGISLRTGHGKWWTIGIFFSGLIFLPVTALHYQKWDESFPRPFMGYQKVLLIFSAFSPIYIVLIVFYQEYFWK